MNTGPAIPLFLLSLAACVSSPAVEPPEDAPTFMQYRAGQDGRIKLAAPSGGVLTQRGKCLGLIRDDGRFATLVWPATARLEFDRLGLVVVDPVGGGRVRLGDYVVFTGGPLPPKTPYPFGDDVHTADMPMECAHYPGYDGWIAIVNPGFKTRPRA
jgi:hypothetical protein